MAGGTVASCVHLVKRRSRTPRCPRSAKRPIALCPKIVSSRPLPPGGGRLIWAFDPCRSTRGGCRQIEASLCQEASGGASKQRRGRGRSVVLGSGSDLLRSAGVQGSAGHAGL